MNPLIAEEPSATRGRTALSVNVNKIALLRNTRSLDLPQVTRLARIALEAGAQGITVHPRPDERHIRRSDVMELRALLRDWPEAEFNIEGNPLHNLLPLAQDVADAGGPLHQLTYVPDSVEQSTSDHGWSLPADAERLQALVARGLSTGARVSLFMDPDASSIAMARDTGAQCVELYTESYARAHGHAHEAAVLTAYAVAARAALAGGLQVNAGHDLNLHNLGAFLREVPGVREVSIGHALVADALELGLAETVRAYLRVIHLAQAGRSV